MLSREEARELFGDADAEARAERNRAFKEMIAEVETSESGEDERGTR